MVKKYFKNSIYGLGLLLTLALFSTSCKQKGEVIIYDIVDSVENCSVPYVVYFHPDFTTQTGNYELTWDFGDGTTSNEKFPVHVYEQTGQFRASLTISNLEAKESRTVMVDLQQESMPILPNFEMSSNSSTFFAPVEVYFDNTTLHGITYNWDFGDNDGSTKKSPVHIFSSPGTYNVKMDAICNGDTASVNQTVSIKPPPSNLIVDAITIWLPDGHTGRDLYVECIYDIHSEFKTYDQNTNSFPISWSINEKLFFFSGDYGSTPIIFQVWAEDDIHDPIYEFEFRERQLQQDGYPEIITWDDGDFGAEVKLKYL